MAIKLGSSLFQSGNVRLTVLSDPKDDGDDQQPIYISASPDPMLERHDDNTVSLTWDELAALAEVIDGVRRLLPQRFVVDGAKPLVAKWEMSGSFSENK